jgi:hypothetical protein
MIILSKNNLVSIFTRAMTCFVYIIFLIPPINWSPTHEFHKCENGTNK